MKIDKVDHVGIAVKDIDATLKFYKENLGVKKEDIEDVTAPGMMRLVTVKLPGANLEFVQYLNDKEILAEYAVPGTDSIHHIGIYVDDIKAVLSAVKKAGGTLIHETPLEIGGGRQIAFALPKSSNVMIEFMEA
jgi:methylmalonyl-CoA epimerase